MKLPVLKARKVVHALERDGFVEDRQKGSHRVFVHPTKPGHVTVPVGAKDIKRGTLRGILKQAGLSQKEFMKLL